MEYDPTEEEYWYFCQEEEKRLETEMSEQLKPIL
jgi:hypothetical protein